MWANNNIVGIISNFHSIKILEQKLKQKKKVDGVCEREQTPVPCPKQNKDDFLSSH